VLEITTDDHKPHKHRYSSLFPSATLFRRIPGTTPQRLARSLSTSFLVDVALYLFCPSLSNAVKVMKAHTGQSRGLTPQDLSSFGA
jgi:hypothetical protein